MLKKLFYWLALLSGARKGGHMFSLPPEEVLKIYKEAETLSNTGTWVLEIGSGELHWSDQVYRIFEVDPKVFPATYEGFLDNIHPDDREKVDEAYKNSLETGLPYEITHRLLLKSGEVKFVTESCKTYYDSEGVAYRSIGTIQDVTVQARLQDEVNQGRRMDSLGKMAGGIAHDYNNLLGVIVGYADIIKTKVSKGSDIYNEILEIKKAAERSVEITRQLLTFSKENYAQTEVLNVNERIVSMDSLLQRLVHENIQIRYELIPNLLRLKISRSELDQILINLVSNARDAMTDGGLIKISTEALASGKMKLSVTDTGEGIEDENMPFLFEPFFSTKNMESGTGLGLSTVYGIVKKYNGEISIESKPGVGTTADIILNLCDQCDLFPDCMPCEEDKDFEIQERMAKIKVMLVEDDLQMKNLVESMILSLGGQVDSFTSPADALDKFSKQPDNYDILMTDVVMPGLNGESLKEKILKIRDDIPVLFISGYTANVISDFGVFGSESNFLSKPFSVNQLKNKLESAKALKP